MKKYIPFSNGTEAMFWIENNCNQCKRGKCKTKKIIKTCGDIPEKQCYAIGATLCPESTGNFLNMPIHCDKFKDEEPQKGTEGLELFK